MRADSAESALCMDDCLVPDSHPYRVTKFPVTPPGVDPETVRLVAQCLNHYATPGPNLWAIQPRNRGSIPCRAETLFPIQTHGPDRFWDLSRLLFHGLISFTNFNAQFLYSLTICMLHYNPRHVSSINMPICRRTNFIITASGIVIPCTVQYSMPDENILLCSLLSSGILSRIVM